MMKGKVLSKVIALTLSAAMLLSGPAVSYGAEGQAAEAASEDYELIIKAGVVTGYTGTPVNVVIPEGVTSIGNSAFEKCENLSSVTIPSSVTSIGRFAFLRCENLSSIEIPSSVTNIGSATFNGTAWLKAQQKKDPLVIVNNILIDGTTAEGDVTIPSSVTEIGELAFIGCDENFDLCLLDVVLYVSENSYAHKYAQEQTYNGGKHFEYVVTTSAKDKHIWDTEYTIDKEATCTEAGSKSIHCQNCGATKDNQNIPATGHTVVTDPAVAATYTSTGKTEGSHCSTCGIVIKAQETIPALTGLSEEQNGVRSYYENGQIKASLTALMKDNGTWYYVEKGVVSGKYTGLVKKDGAWFYVKNSKVDFSYTGLCKKAGNWFYVKKGVVNFGYTGLCKHNGQWFYVNKGVVNFK